jgi:hypothetical protein
MSWEHKHPLLCKWTSASTIRKTVHVQLAVLLGLKKGIVNQNSSNHFSQLASLKGHPCDNSGLLAYLQKLALN